MRIEPNISKYIDVSVDRAVSKAVDTAVSAAEKRFSARVEHYIGVALNEFDHRMGLVKELIETRPTREEVRDIFGEELRPIKAEMQMYREELIDHRTHIEQLERTPA
ncbi:MAG: hypothetical protein WCV82_01025 [Candidatus Paceibacterota bacterium]